MPALSGDGFGQGNWEETVTGTGIGAGGAGMVTGMGIRTGTVPGAVPGAALLMAILAGCSFLDIGENEYRCPGGGDGYPCASSLEVYQMTSGSPLPPGSGKAVKDRDSSGRDGNAGGDGGSAGSPGEGNPGGGTGGGSAGGAGQGSGQGTGAGAWGSSGSGQFGVWDPEDPDPLIRERRMAVGEAYIVPNLPDHPVPVRTPARILRIWVASYEDEKGDLHAPGLIYVEVEPRRWTVAEPEPPADRLFVPLEQGDMDPTIFRK